MDLVAVFALFVFMLSLLCFCVLPFSSVNKDLYIPTLTPNPICRGGRCPGDKCPVTVIYTVGRSSGAASPSIVAGVPARLPGCHPARARRPWNVGTPPSPVVVKFMNRNILEARPVGDDAVPLYRWVARVEWTKRTVAGRHCRIYNRQMSKWRDSTAW